jgi:hypothetical protein
MVYIDNNGKKKNKNPLWYEEMLQSFRFTSTSNLLQLCMYQSEA